MDFEQFDTATDAAKGSILHLKHPQLDHPLYTGDGADEVGRLVGKKAKATAVTALVYGVESQCVQDAVAAIKKAAANGDDIDDMLLPVSMVRSEERRVGKEC